MQKIIAVILDQENNIAHLQDGKKITVYNKRDQNWQIEKEVAVPEIFSNPMPQIRIKLSELMSDLGECKIIVGKSMTGLVYNMFDQAGFIISELIEFRESILDDLFQGILEEMEEMNAEIESNNNIPTSPTETKVEGNYFFDFILLKNSNAPQSSKSAIIPFLNTTRFNQLEIICDHVMPWFEMEMKKRNLVYSVTETSSKKTTIIVKPIN